MSGNISRMIHIAKSKQVKEIFFFITKTATTCWRSHFCVLKQVSIRFINVCRKQCTPVAELWIILPRKSSDGLDTPCPQILTKVFQEERKARVCVCA